MRISMKNGFKQPNTIKTQKPHDKPVDGKNSPWDFTCPQYDQRHSCFLNAGTDYGVCMKQPVGSTGQPKGVVETMPMTSKTVINEYL